MCVCSVSDSVCVHLRCIYVCTLSLCVQCMYVGVYMYIMGGRVAGEDHGVCSCQSACLAVSLLGKEEGVWGTIATEML